MKSAKKSNTIKHPRGKPRQLREASTIYLASSKSVQPLHSHQTVVILGNCLEELKRRNLGSRLPGRVHLTFLDPPFNQGKDYEFHDDDLPESNYWEMMQQVCADVEKLTEEGGAIYFMQREKNTEAVLRCLRDTGWTLQNLIIWIKRTSAVPSTIRYGKQYQVIAFATKGKHPRIFNRLRIDPPLRPEYKYEREDGIFVTDVWDDIRELTSGYFAGDEALRHVDGMRLHKQQSPISLLLRIILSSTLPGDMVLDPFAGTGTTLVVSKQLSRSSLAIEIDPANVKLINERVDLQRKSDSVLTLRQYYRFTPNLEAIWYVNPKLEQAEIVTGSRLVRDHRDLPLFAE